MHMAWKRLRKGQKGKRIKMGIKKKVKTAVMALAVAGMAVTPALPAWAENGIRQDSLGLERKEIKTGTCIKDVYTDKSMYSPNEPAALTVEIEPGKIMQGDSLYLRVRHLNTTVWEQ